LSGRLFLLGEKDDGEMDEREDDEKRLGDF